METSSSAAHYILINAEICFDVVFNIAYSIQVFENRRNSQGHNSTEVWFCGLPHMPLLNRKLSDKLQFRAKPSLPESVIELSKIINESSVERIDIVTKWSTPPKGYADPKMGFKWLSGIGSDSDKLPPISFILIPDGWRDFIPNWLIKDAAKAIDISYNFIKFEIYWGMPSDPTILDDHNLVNSLSLSPKTIRFALNFYRELMKVNPSKVFSQIIEQKNLASNAASKLKILVLSLRSWFSETHLEGMYNFHYSGQSMDESHLSYLCGIVRLISNLYAEQLDVVAIAPDARMSRFCPGLKLENIIPALRHCVSPGTTVLQIKELFENFEEYVTLDAPLAYLSSHHFLSCYSYDGSTALPFLRGGLRIDSFHGMYIHPCMKLEARDESIKYITDGTMKTIDHASPSIFNVERISGLIRLSPA